MIQKWKIVTRKRKFILDFRAIALKSKNRHFYRGDGHLPITSIKVQKVFHF